MFRKKGIVIMYNAKNDTIKGSIYITGGRLVSYATLFLKLKERLNEMWGDNLVITNVVKL